MYYVIVPKKNNEFRTNDIDVIHLSLRQKEWDNNVLNFKYIDIASSIGEMIIHNQSPTGLAPHTHHVRTRLRLKNELGTDLKMMKSISKSTRTRMMAYFVGGTLE